MPADWSRAPGVPGVGVLPETMLGRRPHLSVGGTL